MIKTPSPEFSVKVDWTVVTVFTVSIFLSATLLFSVQPMFAKLVLPLLGGSSSVWNTAMVFFQGTLLGGYIYAHLISKYLDLRLQTLVHTIVLCVGVFFLPLAIASGWRPPETGAQSLWLIALFAVSIGAPFFAISANAPLLQKWFSYTRNKDAQDPYFLYAASNAGSLLSLCLYPILFEPMLRLREQLSLWSNGYIILIVVISLAGILAWYNRGEIVLEDKTKSNNLSTKPSNKQRLFWIFLAFLPSSLMLGVTTHLANNIASAPFLWVIPLALYLFTFVIVFAKRRIVTTQQLAKLFPAVILVAIASGYVLKMYIITSVILSLVSYFIIALLCHSRLVDERPDTAYLTEFYIWMSFGGVLGGAFNALIAPQIFSNVYEYLIVLLLVPLAVPRETADFEKILKQIPKFVLFMGAALVVYFILRALSVDFKIRAILSGSIAVTGLSLARQQKKTLPLDIAILVACIFMLPNYLEKVVFKDRSFFGVILVKEVDDPQHGVVHKFQHGDTIHNYQFRDEKLRKVPLAYYAPENTFDKALKAARKDKGDISVAMIGLGAGAMACYEAPNDKWVYFEIDPAVVEMALNPDLFSFMSECSIQSDIRIGDARLKLQDLPEKSQDFIVIDAFSSDAIPTHLLTQEALSLYQSRLKPDGLLYFHTSNRVMDVSSVVIRLAESMGLSSRFIQKSNFDDMKYGEYYTESTGVLVSKESILSHVTQDDPDWVILIPSPSVSVWSDDYSSIIGSLKSHALSETYIELAENETNTPQ